tara:strand:+ start:5613 stop:6029 length:417 start_codon:yes stop_codon:yes gene_type:complete
LIRKISDKDKKDWENFINEESTLPNKDNLLVDKKKIKYKVVDLHGYSLDEANKFIDTFIRESYENNVQKLIVITGKGLHSQNEKDPYVSKNFGILKHSVPEFIKKNSDLMKIINSIQNASLEDGGSGSFYIYLKKKKN